MKSACDCRTPRPRAKMAPAASATARKPGFLDVMGLIAGNRHLQIASGNATAYTCEMQATRRSDCPAACALDIAGDRWTLLIVRDLLRGRDTYGALASAGEG